jgi:hypothetical protein
MIGGIGCLILAVIAAIIIGISVYKVAHSGIMKQMSGAVKQSELVPGCDAKMQTVVIALNKYEAKNGSYPKKLSALTPTYLMPSDLHCDLDTVSDPNHVTFDYTRPPATAPTTTNVLSFSTNFSMTISGQTIDQKTVHYMTLGGQTSQQTFQNGKAIGTGMGAGTGYGTGTGM